MLRRTALVALLFASACSPAPRWEVRADEAGPPLRVVGHALGNAQIVLGHASPAEAIAHVEVRANEAAMRARTADRSLFVDVQVAGDVLFAGRRESAMVALEEEGSTSEPEWHLDAFSRVRTCTDVAHACRRRFRVHLSWSGAAGAEGRVEWHVTSTVSGSGTSTAPAGAATLVTITPE